MYPNLIYNGDFHKGLDSWTGSGITLCDEGGVTLTGDLQQSIYIPTSNSLRYRITYDIKFNTIKSNNFYIALWPHDSEYRLINIWETNIRNTFTTLAEDLVAGDTTVQLTNATKWTWSNGFVGIFQSKAYKNKRASSRAGTVQSVSGNTVTMTVAYSGDTIPAGTTVANTASSSTYFYPHYTTNANLPTEWTTYTAEFNGGDSMRYSCKYFLFRTLGYKHNYSIRNIKIECINGYQECPESDVNIKAQITKNNIANALSFKETGLKIRYIRDTISGNTVNANNHWNEIQVFNSVGENIAISHPVSIGTTVYTNSYVTDGVIDNNYINGSSGTKTLQLDLGHIDDIYCIKIWHYYYDNRTYYNNVTEVSEDGITWNIVYQGEKPETSAGNTIYLYPKKMSIHDDGKISCREIIEI